MEDTNLSLKSIEEALKNGYITAQEAIQMKQNYTKEFNGSTK